MRYTEKEAASSAAQSWLIPCSPDIYDTGAALQEYGFVIWHQECNLAVGDVAYLYITAPVKEIRYKCVASAVNIPFDVRPDDGYAIDEAFCAKSHRRYMKLDLVETYNNPFLGYQLLLAHGLSGPIRSQRRAVPELAAYIEAASQSFKGSGQT